MALLKVNHLTGLGPPAKQNRSPVTEEQLLRAFKFFYPDAVHVGFRPGVVDFFSTLRTFLDVGTGFVETGFTDAPDLYRALKISIARALLEGTRDSRAKAPIRFRHARASTGSW